MTDFTTDEELYILKVKSTFEDKYLSSNSTIKTSKHIVVAGGCFASIIQNELPRDIDVFILGGQLTHLGPNGLEETLIPNTAVKKDKSKYIVNDKIIDVYQAGKFQYIVTSYKSREELIEHFDYEHCKISYHQGMLYCSPLTYRCIKNKKLVCRDMNKVFTWRTDKFKSRGYTEINYPGSIYDIMSVQPMTGPTAMTFALKSQYFTQEPIV